MQLVQVKPRGLKNSSQSHLHSKQQLKKMRSQKLLIQSWKQQKPLETFLADVLISITEEPEPMNISINS